MIFIPGSMKLITATDRVFGPFADVQTFDDRYEAAGLSFPFSVLGSDHSVVVPQSIPSDFSTDRYRWDGSELTKIPLSDEDRDMLEGQLVSQYMAEAQKMMEAAAQARGYDSLLSVISYAADTTVARWQQEGHAFLLWRSAVWSSALDIKESAAAGDIPIPTVPEFLAMLPEITGLPD